MSQPSAIGLGYLSSLGFGPDSPLMNEPRLLVDGRFLGAIMVELEDELGAEQARRVFYQIGLFHGLRDADRLVAQNLHRCTGDPTGDSTGAEATPLAIALGPRRADASTGSVELSGEWPESYEAQTRLARLGPDETPSCWLSAGYTAGWLSASFDSDIVVVETECTARGDERCRFVSLEAESCRAAGNDVGAALIDSTSLGAFREAAATPTGPTPSGAPETGPLDLGEPAVHVWGPVMVLPFTDVEQALRTVDMLGREVDTAEVRAVVMDLRSAPLDEGYGASILEEILARIDAWGAEPVITGVADLDQELIADLEATRLVVRKDVSEAIAIAFQIAEVQRHLL